MYEREIAAAIRHITADCPDDYAVVAAYRHYRGLYEAAVMCGWGGVAEPIWTLYVRKEAYRRVAAVRGYDENDMMI